MKGSPAASLRARAVSRSDFSGDTSDASATTPASASRRVKWPTRLMFSVRSPGEKPRSSDKPWRRLSPSSRYAVRPDSTSARSTATAMVDLPEAGRPVNQMVAPAWPVACQRWSRSNADGMPTDVGARMGPRFDLPRLDDGAGADGVVGGLIDQDERAAVAVLGVRVGDDDGAGPQGDRADIVERQLDWLVELVERLGIQP